MVKAKINSIFPEKLKNNELLQRGDINYGRVVATEVYDLSFKSHVKQLVKCLLLNFEINKVGDNNQYIFVYSLRYAGRKDYNEIRDLFLEYCPEFALVDVNRVKSLKGCFFKSCRLLGRYLKYKAHKVKPAFLTAILVTEYEVLTKLYKKHVDWNKIRLLGSFCDARCEDNIAVQLGMNRGIKTFTLQHGQYRILRPEFENCDAESYKNFISDRLLAWGEATRNEFKKYGISEKRVVPVGALKGFSFNKKMETIVDNGVFGVILCGDTYALSNIGMIKVANEIALTLNMKYFLRFHPRNNLDMYMKYVDKKWMIESSTNIINDEYAKKVTFSIIHMTGVFVEMLSINSPIFVFDDEYLEDIFRIGDFCFKNSAGLIQIYDQFRTHLEELKKQQYIYYQYFNNSENLKTNYLNALMDLEGDRLK